MWYTSISNGGGEAAVARTQVMESWSVIIRASRSVEPRDKRLVGRISFGSIESSNTLAKPSPTYLIKVPRYV